MKAKPTFLIVILLIAAHFAISHFTPPHSAYNTRASALTSKVLATFKDITGKMNGSSSGTNAPAAAKPNPMQELIEAQKRRQAETEEMTNQLNPAHKAKH